MQTRLTTAQQKLLLSALENERQSVRTAYVGPDQDRTAIALHRRGLMIIVGRCVGTEKPIAAILTAAGRLRAIELMGRRSTKDQLP